MLIVLQLAAKSGRDRDRFRRYETGAVKQQKAKKLKLLIESKKRSLDKFVKSCKDKAQPTKPEQEAEAEHCEEIDHNQTSITAKSHR